MARPRRAFSSGPRRLTTWEQGPGGTSFTTLTDTSPTIVGAGAVLVGERATLVRLRGDAYVQLLLAAASGDHMSGALGIGIVNDQAFATGISAMPAPITEQDWDGWIWWKAFAVMVVTDTEAVDSALNSWHFPIDTKAMRKMQAGDTLFISAQASVEGGTVSTKIFVDTRALLKLP